MASRNAILNALRKEQGLARQRVGRARKKSLAVPVGGWNTRDSDTRIGPLHAQKFTNLISSRDGVRPRQNPTVYATCEPASLEPGTLMVHNGTDGTDAMFVVADGELFDVTAGGTIAAAAVTGLTNNIMSHANINGRLVWANGFDAPQSYDGSTWSVQPISVATGEPAVSTDKLAGVYPFKNRVYWWQPNEMGFYYSTLDTIGDGLKFFDLSYVAREGGDLLTITRYTVDGGSGPDDYPVFITSKGEAIIYQGTNPNDASAWSFVGTYRLGKPPQTTTAPQRQHIAESWGAQTWLITDQDYVALPQAVITEGIVRPSLLSGAIQDAMNANSSQPGWQALLYPKGPWMLFNVPTNSTNPPTYEQHIIDLHTMAPSRLTGMNGRVWGVYNDDLYYATQEDSPTGKVTVYKALTTSTPVSIELLPGATNFKSGSKAFTSYRVWASTSAGAFVQSSATTELRTDYTDSANNTTGPLRWNEWILAGGIGTYVQLEILGSVDSNIEIKHIEYVYEEGDPLTSFRDA